jgi:hypothetical protein
MKTFQEIRQEVISDISIGEMMGKDKQYSFAQIEELAAKEYAKQWVDRCYRDTFMPQMIAVNLKKEIDAQ